MHAVVEENNEEEDRNETFNVLQEVCKLFPYKIQRVYLQSFTN
jgi:hypothetical protein